MSSASPPETGRATRHFAGTFATNVAIALIGFVTGSISARVLGPTGRGELAAIQALPGLLGWVAVLGVPNAIAFYVARMRGARRDVFLTGTLLTSGFSVIVTGFAVLLVPAITGEYPAEVGAAARTFLLMIPLQALQLPPVMSLWSMQRFGAWNVLRLTPSLCWLAALVLAISRNAATAPVASKTYLALYACTVPLLILAFSSATTGPWRVRRSIGRRLLRYGAPTALAIVPSVLNYRLDQTLMAALLPASTLGLYAVSVSWSGALAPLTSAIASVLFPRLASSSSGAAADTLGRGLRLAVFLAIAGTLAAAVATPVALPLIFGEPFRVAVPAAVVLVVAGGFSSLNGVLEESLRGLGGTRWPLFGQAAGLPVTVALLLLLLRPLGLYGAAISSLAAYATTTVVLVIGATRMTGRTARELLVPTRGEVAAINGAYRATLRAMRPKAEIQP